MKINLTLIALLILAFTSYGQNEPSATNKINSNSISLNLIGAPAVPIGISYGQMLTNRFSFEVGVGVLSTGAGFNYYLTNPEYHRFNIYTGFFAAINYDGFPMLYLPVGVSYFGKKNFQYSVDVGIMSSENVSLTGDGSNPSPWFGLKIGYRFGDDLAALKAREKTTLKNIISISLGIGDPVLGVVYERLLTPRFGAEAGLGLFGVTAGTKFYLSPISEGHLNFHIGVSESWGVLPMVGSNGFRTYFPLGVTVLSKNRVRFSIDAGPIIWHQDNNSVTPSVSIKIGKAF